MLRSSVLSIGERGETEASVPATSAAATLAPVFPPLSVTHIGRVFPVAFASPSEPVAGAPRGDGLLAETHQRARQVRAFLERDSLVVQQGEHGIDEG